MTDPGLTELAKAGGWMGAVLALLLGAFLFAFRQMFVRQLKFLDEVVPVLREIADSLKASEHGRTEAVAQLKDIVEGEADRVIREVKPTRGARS